MKSQKRDEEALRAKEKEALAKESAARSDHSQLSLSLKSPPSVIILNFHFLSKVHQAKDLILSNYGTFAGQRQSSFGRRWLPSLPRWRRE